MYVRCQNRKKKKKELIRIRFRTDEETSIGEIIKNKKLMGK